MNPRAIRALRAGIAAGVATQVALLSHILAGGAALEPLLVALTFVVSWIVCLALVGPKLSLLRLALSVALSQFAFHSIFSVLGGAVSSGASAGHAHHGAEVLPALTTTAVSSALPSADPVMWLGHALAAALTTLVLFRGEQAVRTAGAPLIEFVRLVFAAVTALPVAVRNVVPAVHSRIVDPMTRVIESSVSRRGPPSALPS